MAGGGGGGGGAAPLIKSHTPIAKSGTGDKGRCEAEITVWTRKKVGREGKNWKGREGI